MTSQRSRVGTLGRIVAVSLIVASVHFGALAATIKKADWVGEYQAVAMGTGHVGAAAGRASRVDLDVYRWTTPEERKAILEVLATGDAKKIRKGLDSLPDVGRIRLPGTSGYELIYAYQFDEGGKKRVVVAANRPFMSLPGATMGNTVDFLVGVAVLELDASGEGTGTMAPAIELAFKPDGELEITESAADPVQLTSVKSTK
jgi:hypothetical protein